MVVAIDGPAGVGKSTVAKRLAEELSLFYINSGNFYRAITRHLLKTDRNPESMDELLSAAQECLITITDGRVYCNGEDIEDELHTDSVDQYVAQHSAYRPVREIVNEQLRKVSKDIDLVAEGRDMTTIVFPEADYKFYLDAGLEIRAERRYNQQETTLQLQAIQQNLSTRDEVDTTKEYGALRQTPEAYYIDTSHLTIDEVCEKVLKHIQKNGKDNQESRNVLSEKGTDKNSKEEQKTQKPSASEMQNMLQEEYLNKLDDIEEGQLITGHVVEFTGEFVFVDVGFKSEGRIPVEEFEHVPSIGDEVQVVLISKEGKHGQTIVSKKKADIRVTANSMKDAFKNSEPVEGTFDRVIKGGYEVAIQGALTAFCPLSKAAMRRIEDPEEMIGITDYFLIDKMHADSRVKPVVSRRAYLEKEIDRRKADFFAQRQVGDEVEGVVKSFTSFGAFIDLGGFDGLLHINDMSWGHVTRPKDYVKKGQKINLKLIHLDTESQKINLSLKHFTPDPWESFIDHYDIEQVVKGKVTKMTDFGVFIELQEGIEGLAHISELSWIKRINHPKEVVSIGDDVEAMILGYDIDARKVSLGLKQVQPNPWDSIEEHYPVGKVMNRKVIKVTNAGAFIQLEEGIDGFLHIDDTSWTKKLRNMSAFCKEGEMMDVVVIRIDEENRRIRLGVKQLSDNPWQQLKDTYPKGSVIEGEVTGITDFGVFVRVYDDIDGLISKYNLANPEEEYTDEILKRFKEGDRVKAMVMDVNPSAKKLSLSIRDLIRQTQKKEISKYIHDDHDDEGDTFTFADLMKEKNQDSEEE